MLLVGENYKHGQNVTTCPLCNDHSECDSQLHLLKCSKLNISNIVDKRAPDYEDLFCQNTTKKHTVAELLKQNITKRTKLINQEESRKCQFRIGPGEPETCFLRSAVH